MADLTPYPFARLITKMLREADEKQAIFDLPLSKCFTGSPDHSLSVSFHGLPASTPLGPAAGPHSQLAQNIVLAWLGGSRIIELKTVQVLDELEIPRPCIDMRNVGYNVEWSQELRLEQSLEEYVKASMLIEILRASDVLDLTPGSTDTIFDMSVGYDLAGIQSERVLAFIRGMMDASVVVDRLRAQIPAEFERFRDLAYPTRLSTTLTLSTFHGCPPDEIERIIRFLQDALGLNCVIKLNPTLLGPELARGLLNDEMGYRDIRIPNSAFENDTKWDQAVGFIERLKGNADRLGLGFGVKFSNTLIVEHDGVFLPTSEKEKYLSGPPLHVLAMHLVGQLRRHFGDTIPISFSAGIDRANFADAVSLGLVPITVCSDLLKTGGYARPATYFKELRRRMEDAGASTRGDFIIYAHGNAERALTISGVDSSEARHALTERADLRSTVSDDAYERWLGEAKLLNTTTYVDRATSDPRYAQGSNSMSPKKVGTRLELFNCLTCDKCIPVCPNDANFRLVLPPRDIPIVKVRQVGDGWKSRDAGTLTLDKKHQIANFADFCNDCGNCDIFCPEDGGPYILKPRFFGSRASFDEFSNLDGFFLERKGQEQQIAARIDQNEFTVGANGDRVWFKGDGFAIEFSRTDPEGTIEGAADGEVDLTYFHIIDLVREAIFESADINYVNA